MAKIDFYYLPESPPCRAVEMVAAIAGVTLEKHYISLFTKEHLGEEYMKINPAHKVPFIKDGDLKMGESRAIMTYLVNKYMPADTTLYPKDPEKRAKVDELLYFDIGSLWAAGTKLLRPKIFSGATTLDAEAEKAFHEVLEIMDKHLEKSGTKCYLGDDLTLGDISVAATLSFVDACEFDYNQHKSLRAYFDRMRTVIPKYAEINDEPVENMKKFIKSKQTGQ